MITTALSPTGAALAAGPPGESAYQLWLDNGNTGTVQQYLQTLVGPMGPPGPTGPAGPVGSQGYMGLQGPAANLSIGTVTTSAPGSAAAASVSGPAGNQALNLTLPTGNTGPTGATGPIGPTGLSTWQTPPVAWAASTAYSASPPASVVVYGGQTYVCSTTHTSTSTFDTTKFTLIAAMGATGSPSQGAVRYDISQGLTAAQQAQALANLTTDGLYARRRNRIVDPGVRVSQQQGSASNAFSGTSSYVYPSDSVQLGWGLSAGAGTVQQLALTTPGGSPNRIRVTCTTANTSPAANDYVLLQTKIEGVDVADLLFGAASAHTIGVRFGCRSSVAGTFPVILQNSGTTRSWIGTFSISPAQVGIDTVQTVSLVGDTAGTWNTGNSTGLTLLIGLCAGSTYQGAMGWQGGNYVGLAPQTNFMATANATFDWFDLGLYDTTGLQTGTMPPFELGDYLVDYQKCLRYFVYASGLTDFFTQFGNGAYQALAVGFPVPMRVAPSMIITGTVSSGAGWNSGYPLAQYTTPLRTLLRGDINSSTGYAYVNWFQAFARLS